VEQEAENARQAAKEAILEKEREKERAKITKEIRESSRQGRDSRIFREEKRTREIRPVKPPVEVETTAEKNQSLQESLRAVIDKRRVRVKEELYVDEQAR
jgi:Mg-chelatase subunit ChlD